MFDISNNIVPKKKEPKLVAGQPIWLLAAVAGAIIAVISTVLGLYAHGSFDDEYAAAARRCHKSWGGEYRAPTSYEIESEKFVDVRNWYQSFTPNPNDALCETTDENAPGGVYRKALGEAPTHFVYEIYPDGKKAA